MLETFVAAYLGSLVAGLTLLLPIYRLVKKKVNNFNPMTQVFGAGEE